MRAFDANATSLLRTAIGRVLRLTLAWIVALTLLAACGEASPPATEAEPPPATEAEPPPATEAEPPPATEAPPPVPGPRPSPPATANGGGSAGSAGAGAEPEVPQFPWPPPRASASVAIPDGFIAASGSAAPTLGDVAAQIHTTLDGGGYVERSYFAAPGGFAMVTRLERINADGTPMQDPERWRVEAQPLGSFSLRAYLQALFTAPSGHYRIIVFVVSSQPLAQSEAEVSRSEALAWLHEGLNRLPDSIAGAAYTDRHVVTALIYEFEQPGRQEAVLVLPGNLTGRAHLERAMLWQAFSP
jgi:hypothetical protein